LVLADNSLLAAAAEEHNLHFSENKTRKSYINSTKLCMLKQKHTEHVILLFLHIMDTKCRKIQTKRNCTFCTLARPGVMIHFTIVNNSFKVILLAFWRRVAISLLIIAGRGIPWRWVALHRRRRICISFPVICHVLKQLQTNNRNKTLI
jgi:hypothetical protein